MFLPGESHGQRSLADCTTVHRVVTSQTRLSDSPSPERLRTARILLFAHTAVDGQGLRLVELVFTLGSKELGGVSLGCRHVAAASEGVTSSF